jgi:tetraacyldisaccharide 4'-kinase
VIERVWYGADVLARVARASLAPAEVLYGRVVAARNAAFDRGWRRTNASPIPVVSVGNLTVGGTGKTPVAAWLAGSFRARGATPVIVLRGYGADEPLVHQRLNPEVPVIVNPDRLEGVRRATIAAGAEQDGADVAILDDAFQHRQLRRTADVVLVNADRWTGDARLLPAGPFREPLTALRRATLVLLTRKAAPVDRVDAIADQLIRVAPAVPFAALHLAPDALIRVGDALRQELSVLSGRSVRTILSIADPRGMIEQLRALGAIVEASIYPDHHRFSPLEIAALASAVKPDEMAVCTLKDAVKLQPHWPRHAPPLWYVSQRIVMERGAGAIDRLLSDVLNARRPSHP